MEHIRKLRLNDFERREKNHPGGIYIHPHGDGEYLPVHPFADESELLVKLNMKPELCRSVDAYWRIDNDVIFIQVGLSADDPLGRSGFFARWSDIKPSMLNLVAIIKANRISRFDMESVMSKFVQLGSLNCSGLGYDLGNNLKQIGP